MPYIRSLFFTFSLILFSSLVISCGGDNSANQNTTNFTVTSTGGSGGNIYSESVTVNFGEVTSFTVIPDIGFIINSVTGCGGTLVGNIYTTSRITADCTVNASFIDSAASPSLAFTEIKKFRISWNDVTDASHYRILENADGTSGFTQVSGDIPAGVQVFEFVVPLYQRLNAQYILQTCFTSGCNDSASVSVSGTLASSIGYIKASNSEAADRFGVSVSLSADGYTLAVGAKNEGSSNWDQSDNSGGFPGAVYVFRYDGINWIQQAYLKASNIMFADYFGLTLSLSADGNTLAVGAWDGSSATGVNGNQNNNGEPGSGAAYVFSRSGDSWTQQAYLKASNTSALQAFGHSMSISADGNTLAVGDWRESNSATGINGNQSEGGLFESGAVYLFVRNGSTWSQEAYIKASNTGSEDYFGRSLSISADGNTLAVGAMFEDSSTKGIDGEQNNSDAFNAGAVYVFNRSGSNWTQQSYIKASNTGPGDGFGSSVSISGDGNTLAVGAPGEGSTATGIGGDQNNNGAPGSGAIYLFTKNSNSWAQQAYIKASNSEDNDLFGESVGISTDGNTLVVGASHERSNATGINGDQNYNFINDAGAAYVFNRNGSIWTQQAYIKSSNTTVGDLFGGSISISGDGNTIAVGAVGERSLSTGIGGLQYNGNAYLSGAVYLY